MGIPNSPLLLSSTDNNDEDDDDEGDSVTRDSVRKSAFYHAVRGPAVALSRSPKLTASFELPHW